MSRYCATHQEMREAIARGLDGPGISPLDVYPQTWAHCPGFKEEMEHRRRKIEAIKVRRRCGGLDVWPLYFLMGQLTLDHSARHRDLLDQTVDAPPDPKTLVFLASPVRSEEVQNDDHCPIFRVECSTVMVCQHQLGLLPGPAL